MPPPLEEGQVYSYFHVGSLAKECLAKGYRLGVWELDSTTKTKHDIVLGSFGEGNPTLTPASGGIELYKEWPVFHAVCTWLTANAYLADVGARGGVLGGSAYATLKTTISPQEEESKFKARIKLGLERSPGKVELIVPVYKEPLLMGYAVVTPTENTALGYRSVYNVDKKQFAMHAFCLGYHNETTEVGLKLENFKTLRGSVFQRLGEKLAFALKMTIIGAEENATSNITIGTQYEFSPGHLLKARLRDDSQFGIVYQSRLAETVDVMYHVGCELKDPINGEHKIGVAWSFEC
nr:voltage-dependent anion-selective channel-like [Drosophila bipectinata]